MNVVDAIIADRQKNYGDPKNMHEAIAKSWSGFLHAQSKITTDLTPADVAGMMSMMKMCRDSFRLTDDNIVDRDAYLKFYDEFTKGQRDENENNDIRPKTA